MSDHQQNMDLDGLGDTGVFQRIPSESVLDKSPVLNVPERLPKPWERSQSAMDLKNKDRSSVKMVAMDYDSASADVGNVSEHSRVYWDLSQMEEDQPSNQAHASGANSTVAGQNKFKISLQTIHQKQEMKASTASTSNSTSPKYSVTARMVRRLSSESVQNPHGVVESTNVEVSEYSLPPLSPNGHEKITSPTVVLSTHPMTSTATSHKSYKFAYANHGGKPNLTLTLSQAVPVMQENIMRLRASTSIEQQESLQDMLEMIQEAWATPVIGRDLAYGLCDVLRNDGGLELLINNCDKAGHDVKLSSARLLEQSMTVSNRDEVANKGLEVIVKLASNSKDDRDMTKAVTGILENLFKHSEDTCTNLIKFGGLDSILYFIRTSDTKILRHCAIALANLAIFGGQENQTEMIYKKAAEWLFPLAFSSDDSIRYYAFLAIAALSANKEIESSVVQSGTLDLVEPFVQNHDPMEFAQSDKAHIHGQSKEWLFRLVPLLSSKRDEAQSLAAFHFAMEAGIKKNQGNLESMFKDIGAIEPLKKLASGTNKLASKFASQALKIIGEEIPYQLSPQVPLWSVEDVNHWLIQCGFKDEAKEFSEYRVDGDLLLQLTETNLKDDLSMNNGITRKRFLRELNALKIAADYQSCDPSKVDDWLKQMGPEFRRYSYQMLINGVDRKTLCWLSEDHLTRDCLIGNGIHRMKILEATKLPLGRQSFSDGDSTDALNKPIDCFISYRRSNGSQLASLLKVHLQLRGFSVFLDIEKLQAGKFDDNLLNSVKNAKNFIMVLTPAALDRCVDDVHVKDWVHREIVAALEGGCNIIPITDNFEWPAPESLPNDMRPLCYFNGIRWIHDYQDACVDKLEQFLRGEINPKDRALMSHSSLGHQSSSSSLNHSPEMHGVMLKQHSGGSGVHPLSHAPSSRGSSSLQNSPGVSDTEDRNLLSKRGNLAQSRSGKSLDSS